MYMDNELILSSEQTLTATDSSDNVVDFGAEGDAIGREMYLEVAVGATALSSEGKNATLTVALRTADALDGGGALDSPTTLFTSAAIAEASLAAGAKVLQMRVPMGMKRYADVNYTVGTENFTGGTINAHFVPSIDRGW